MSKESPQKLPSPERVRTTRRRLLAWYEREKRDLPWRRTEDPYAIWISEAMLQQTRVETVIDYWRRFLERFPDVRALAAAEEDDVLAAWSGLGYYRRARTLRLAAQRIVELGGRFPEDREGMLALPGVGPYTAGAVLSIAFGRAEALVDGNVTRVFARLFGLDGPVDSRALQAAVWDLARAFVPTRGGAGIWNQALMELGATVCKPRRWRCDACPLAASCVARRDDRVGELPGPKTQRAVVPVELEIAICRRPGDAWLLERRPKKGRMAGMWQLPTREVPTPDRQTNGLFPDAFPLPLALEEELCAVRHGITHHRIRARAHRARLTRDPVSEPCAWVPDVRLAELALTGMTRKVLRGLPRSVRCP